MRWEKRGRIYVPDGTRPWARTHAFPPTPLWVSDDVLRLYVGMCDENTVSRVGYVEVDADDPGRVLRVSPAPVLDIGAPGNFDENGVLPTCIVPVDGALHLYYVGYQLGARVPYFQFQGLARSEDGGLTFHRVSRVPVIDRSDAELHHRTSAFVRRRADGSFEMWYTAGGEWIDVAGKPLPRYRLHHLTSPDGVRWGARGRPAWDFADDDEHAFGRPWIAEIADRTLMFYSVRTRSKDYRLGVAETLDGGSTWHRRDEEVGIDVSATGWDSEMVAYASVVHRGDRTFLFYNGNRRGRTGFGWAELA